MTPQYAVRIYEVMVMDDNYSGEDQTGIHYHVEIVDTHATPHACIDVYSSMRKSYAEAKANNFAKFFRVEVTT